MIHADVALANLREGFAQLGLPFDMENADMTGESIILTTEVNGYTFEVGFSKPRQSYFFKMMDGRIKEATSIEMFVDFFSTYTRLQTDFLPKARDAANAFSVVSDRAYKFSKVTGNKSTGYKAMFIDGASQLTVSEDNDVYVVQSEDKKYEYYFVDGTMHMQYTWDSYLDRIDMENTDSDVEAEADERTFEIKLRRGDEYACFTPIFTRESEAGVMLRVTGDMYIKTDDPFSLDAIIDAYNHPVDEEFHTKSQIEVVDDNKIYVKEGTGVVPEFEDEDVAVQRVYSTDETEQYEDASSDTEQSENIQPEAEQSENAQSEIAQSEDSYEESEHQDDAHKREDESQTSTPPIEHYEADEIVEFHEESQAQEPEKFERRACTMADSTISVSKVVRNGEVLYLQFIWNGTCYDMPLEMAKKHGIPLKRIYSEQELESRNGVAMTDSEFESGTFARDLEEDETLANSIISAFFSGR